MKKRVYIIVFLCTIFLGNNGVYAIEIQSQTSHISQIQQQKTLPQASNISKKKLKKELKRKKKFHKSLVENYNKTFNKKYLPLIQKNSEKITTLQSML